VAELLAETRSNDLVFCDIRMPGITGPETHVRHRRRRARVGKPLPVADAAGRDVELAIEFDDCFSPVTIRWTVARLNSVVKTRRPVCLPPMRRVSSLPRLRRDS